ncbi:hypothetical protein RJ639_001580 [Escallonia herrerae]|uniref:TLC domain-containing protein n=1 Tax=Escallonia herrerae TaxID=1293975 RepID=A0AA88X7K5_9ASTE|nr:hypothetical protein RJ639_001580 [Escallonia herrerae]
MGVCSSGLAPVRVAQENLPVTGAACASSSTTFVYGHAHVLSVDGYTAVVISASSSATAAVDLVCGGGDRWSSVVVVVVVVVWRGATFAVVFILLNQWIKNGSNELFEHSQLVGGTWPWAYLALCFSCGYFAYDQGDMLRYRLFSAWIPSILVHHLILLVCFTLALYRNVTINYLILTLICEEIYGLGDALLARPLPERENDGIAMNMGIILGNMARRISALLHSIFLHVRKVRRMAGVRDGRSKFVKAEWFFNWVAFLGARFTSHILITLKLIKDASKFGKGVELPLALFGMAGMNLLNIFLGIDLFNAYSRERKTENRHNHHE